MQELLTETPIPWLAPFIPSVELAAFLVPASVLYAGACAWLVGWLRTTRRVRTPYTRKIFHFTIFTTAGLIQLAWGLPGVVIFGSVVAIAVLYAIYRGAGFPFYEALARVTDAPRRTMFIVIPLLTTALGGVLANLFFADLAYVGYLVCGWGDAVGEPVGTRWGNHRYRVPSLSGVPATRSLEGSAAVFVVGTVAAFFGMLVAGVVPGNAALAAVAAGGAGTAVEAISNHGLDNLTVQVAAAAAATLALWI